MLESWAVLEPTRAINAAAADEPMTQTLGVMPLSFWHRRAHVPRSLTGSAVVALHLSPATEMVILWVESI